MDADDLILISVDDHIAEPADMFDAHVPAGTRSTRRGWSSRRSGKEQWWYGDLRGRNLGPQRRRRKAARHVQHRCRRGTTRCAPAASTSTSGCAT